MSPLLAVGFCGREDANTVIRGLFAEPVSELFDDAVLRLVRPTGWRSRCHETDTVGDDHEATQAQQIRAAVQLRVEARAGAVRLA